MCQSSCSYLPISDQVCVRGGCFKCRRLPTVSEPTVTNAPSKIFTIEPLLECPCKKNLSNDFLFLSILSSLLNFLKMKPQERMFFRDPVNIIRTRLERIAQVYIVMLFIYLFYTLLFYGDFRGYVHTASLIA